MFHTSQLRKWGCRWNKLLNCCEHSSFYRKRHKIPFLSTLFGVNWVQIFQSCSSMLQQSWNSCAQSCFFSASPSRTPSISRFSYSQTKLQHAKPFTQCFQGDEILYLSFSCTIICPKSEINFLFHRYTLTLSNVRCRISSWTCSVIWGHLPPLLTACSTRVPDVLQIAMKKSYFKKLLYIHININIMMHWSIWNQKLFLRKDRKLFCI